MILRRDEVLIVDVPFHQSGGSKTRPVIVILDSGDADFVAVPVTSRSRSSAFDLVLQDWKEAGLHQPCVVRVDKILILPKASIHFQFGRLSTVDSVALTNLNCRAFCPSIH